MEKNRGVTNGNGREKKPFDAKEVEFPVTFALKAVMDGTVSDEDNRGSLSVVFNLLEIDHKYENQRVSSKGNYVSFTYNITLISKEQMVALYERLKKVKGLKLAI